MIKILAVLSAIAWTVFFILGYIGCFSPTSDPLGFQFMSNFGEAAALTLIAAIPLTIASIILKVIKDQS